MPRKISVTAQMTQPAIANPVDAIIPLPPIALFAPYGMIIPFVRVGELPYGDTLMDE